MQKVDRKMMKQVERRGMLLENVNASKLEDTFMLLLEQNTRKMLQKYV
jgi:hypothetical protein